MTHTTKSKYDDALQECFACENKGKINLSPEDDGDTHPCEDCKPVEFENWRLKVALGYHLNADSYESTFPDDENDYKYLKKQATWNRLKARTILDDKLSHQCGEAMKSHTRPMLKELLDAIDG